ncbi:hypothetical protein PN36_12240 [Candidatus Thiomargarita nelsonii]|uniref:Endonuclease/exonuclease/phosphatase domain-containing protein n=1 Tax=Candidatus Thiomargarita nelsonii TaxID=1003181 RepID=A0A4E0QPN8_9GAMM|nr:hypothetical protein PN36_12240 [Candidatus Thiomargarita nelsonii]
MKTMNISIKQFFLRRFKLLTVFLLLLSFVGYLGAVHWTFDLFSHFKVQYFALLLFCAFVFLLARQWKWLFFGLLGVFINGVVVLSLYAPPSDFIRQNNTLKLLLSNVNVGNDNFSALIQLVRSEQPDILIVQEWNAHWRQQLKIFDKTLPYIKTSLDSGVFGTIVLSRFPFEEAQILSLGSGELESILVKIRVNDKVISLLTTHPWPPISGKTFEHRNSQLFEVNSFLKDLSSPKIVIGDLNISMWSPIYSFLSQELVNARQGFGILPTWPTFMPFMMIPIDHCLVSSDVNVLNLKTATSIGSDHLPLIVELAL